MLLTYILAFVHLITPVSTSNSPVKARIHQSAFSFFRDLGKQLVGSNLMKTYDFRTACLLTQGLNCEISEVRGKTTQCKVTQLQGFDIDEEGRKLKVPDYETKFKRGSARVFELSISEFEAPNFDLKLAEDGLRWHASGGKVKIAGKFQVHYKIIGIKMRKTGNIRGSAWDLNLDLTAKTVNVNGKPQVRMGSCSANLNHIRISFHGSGIVPWVINKFHKKFEKGVQKAIREQACELAQKALKTKVNQKIMEMPSHIPLPQGFAVDYSLEEDPFYTKDYVDANLNALVLHSSTTCVQKGRRGEWNDVGPRPRMATVWLGEDVANCFASSAHESATFKYLVTEEDETAKDYLRTTCPLLSICAGMFFEDLEEKYQDQYVDVLVHLYKNVPVSRFDGNGIWVNATVAADICMNGTCTEKDALARIVFNVNTCIHPEIKDNKFVGTISDLTLVASEEFSNIGHIGTDFLNLMTGSAFTSSIKAAINDRFQEGIPLPSINFKQFTISTTSEVTVLDGAVRLNLDFSKLN